MAADTDNHRAYCNHLTHPTSFSLDTSHQNQDISISELIDHGSISFGRFSVESLAWEKRSVFSHNKYQEEVEKFKAPGLVAQKKAYFEEYYRKIRALKKLQSEQQEESLSNLCEEKICSNSQVQNSVEITESKEDKSLVGTDQIKLSGDKTNAHRDPLGQTTKEKSLVSEKRKETHNDKVSKRDLTIFTMAEAEREDLSDKTALVPASSAKMCSKSYQPHSLDSITVKLNAKKLKDHNLLSKSKGPSPLAKDKTKLNRTRKIAAIPSEKGKQFLDEDKSGKSNGNGSLVLSERLTPRPGRNVKSENSSSHRNPTKLHANTTNSRTSVSTRMPTTYSSTKDSLAKANTEIGPTSKRTSRQINLTKSMNDVVGKRPSVGKSLEASSGLMTPKRGQSENQKPKITSMNHPAQAKANQNLGCKSELMNHVGAGKQIKETRGASGRVPTIYSSTASPSGASKTTATNHKVEHKIVPWQSGDLTHSQRGQRNKMPSWR